MDKKARKYRINGLLADFDTNRLESEDGEVRLPPKPMALLLRLIQNEGRPVSRETLIEEIWDGNIYVGRRGVTDAIWRLRRAMDDTSENPKYIETIPKTGYRLLVPAIPIAPAMPTIQTEPQPPNTRSSKPAHLSRKRFTWISFTVFIGLTTTLLLRESSPKPTNAGSLQMLTVTTVTNRSGIEHDASITSDGKRLAFAWMENNNSSRICVKSLNNKDSEAQPLENGTGWQRFPSWAPDGQRIAFINIPGAGPPGIVVFHTLTGEKQVFDKINLRSTVGIEWSPVSEQIAFTGYDPESGQGGIRLLNLITSEIQTVTSRESAIHFTDHSPVWSPDGTRIVFARVSGMGEDLYLTNLNGTPRQLTKDGTRIWGADWTPDGRSLIFSSSRLGDQGYNAMLWRIELDTNTIQPLGASPDHLTFPVIAPDGKSLFAYHSKPKVQVSAIPLAPDKPTEVTPLIVSTTTDEDPDFSLRANRLVFASTRDGGKEIWTSNLDGGDPKRLTSMKRRAAFPKWSPDGSRIVFVAFDNSQSRRTLYLLNPENGDINQLGGPQDTYICPSWSRDGNFIYAVKHIDGNLNLWRLPVESGTPKAITEDGGFFAQESPDGATLYFSKNSKSGLWAKPTKGGPERLIIDWRARTHMTWLPLANQILFLAGGQNGPMILAYNLQDQTMDLVRQLKPGTGIANRPWTLIEATNTLLVSQGIENEGDIRQVMLPAQ